MRPSPLSSRAGLSIALVAALLFLTAPLPVASGVTPDVTAVTQLPTQPAGIPATPTDEVPFSSPEAAQEALATVQAAFAGETATVARAAEPSTENSTGAPAVTAATPDLSLALRDLRLRAGALNPAQQRIARAYLARPTGSYEPFGASYGRNARPTSDCNHPRAGSHVCVHWAKRTGDAPKRADRDHDGIPNQVERTRAVMNHVWDRIVTQGGYRAPLKDGKRGGNGKLDVYLANIGKAGLYGYCVNEKRVRGRAFDGYCVLDDDYSHREFPQHTSKENLQVTAAHEFFHAVQFAYDARADSWFMESSATWMEDEIYDKVNDNRFYLEQSPLAKPTFALDFEGDAAYPLTVYGAWIWWRYLTEHVTGSGDARTSMGLPVLMRELWERVDHSRPRHPGTYSVKALTQALAARGLRLEDVYADFAVANRRPADNYEEGAHYKPAPLVRKFGFTATDRSLVDVRGILDHLSSATVAFVPDDSYGSAVWRLTITLDLPAAKHDPVARVSVVHTDGTVETARPTPSSTGPATVVVPFATTGDQAVRRVELTMVNGGHRYTCGKATSWSCHGRPKDDNQAFTFSAVANQ